MRRHGHVAWTLLACVVLLSACAGSRQAGEEPPDDARMQSMWRLARFTFDQGNYQQAAELYQAALSRAYARDDGKAIGEIGFESALTLLRAGKPRKAARRAVQIRTELERRKAEPFAELLLTEAVARYHLNELRLARNAARQAIARASPDDRQTTARAWVIAGLIAADTNDRAALEQALSGVGTPSDDALRADKAELTGHRLMLAGDPEAAGEAFMRAAKIRQDEGDYVGMARVLALAGASAESAGDLARAANLYYRAGRSAAAQQDFGRAKAWLYKTRSLAIETNQAALEGDASTQLRLLETGNADNTGAGARP